MQSPRGMNFHSPGYLTRQGSHCLVRDLNYGTTSEFNLSASYNYPRSMQRGDKRQRAALMVIPLFFLFSFSCSNLFYMIIYIFIVFFIYIIFKAYRVFQKVSQTLTSQHMCLFYYLLLSYVTSNIIIRLR